MNVILPDESKLELDEGATAADAAAAIGAGLAKAALAARVNDHLVDLARPLSDGDAIAIITAKRLMSGRRTTAAETKTTTVMIVR